MPFGLKNSPSVFQKMIDSVLGPLIGIYCVSYIDDVLCHSVIKNVAHLCGRSRSKMWGSEGWKKIVVCVVSDGRNKVNKRTLQVLSLVCPQNSTCYATEYA